MGVAITSRGLSHTYRTADGPLTVLGGLDLDVADTGYAAITGPSGAGKTTLLSLLGGLEQLQTGRIEIGGQDLTGLSGDGLAAYRPSGHATVTCNGVFLFEAGVLGLVGG